MVAPTQVPFPATGVNRRDLLTATLSNATSSCLVAGVLAVYLRTLTQPGHVLPASWGGVLFALLVVTTLVGGLTLPLRRLTRCLRAPRRLAGVAGVHATILPRPREVGPSRAPTRLTTDAGEVRVHFLSPDRALPTDAAGVLYQRGRTAVFVTSTSTRWAV